MSIILITGPAQEPISLAEAKAHCEVVSSDYDSWFPLAITAARQMAETELRRSLVTQTWERVLDAFPSDADDNYAIRLGMPPLQSIVSVKYINAQGQQIALVENADYVMDNVTEPGYVLPFYGTLWPDTMATVNAVRVRFIAGYGDQPSSVPGAIRQWILMQIGTLFENRESIVVQAGAFPTELPQRFIGGLLDRFRVYA